MPDRCFPRCRPSAPLQKPIIRILFMVPIYGIASLFSLCFKPWSIYIDVARVRGFAENSIVSTSSRLCICPSGLKFLNLFPRASKTIFPIILLSFVFILFIYTFYALLIFKKNLFFYQIGKKGKRTDTLLVRVAAENESFTDIKNCIFRWK